MRKFKVNMVWGGDSNKQWMMNLLHSGFFLMNFPNCRNVNKFFERLNQNTDNPFEIIIKPIRKSPRVRKLACIFTLLMMLASQASAETVAILTLDKCVESALEHNSSLKISALHIDQSRFKKNFAKGAMLPSLSSSAYGALSTDQPVFTFDVKAMQPLFLGGELLARKRKSEAQEGIASSESDLKRTDVVYAVKRVFFEIKKAEVEVKLLEEELIHAKKLRDVEQKLTEKDYQTQSILLKRVADAAEKEKALIEKEQHLQYLYDFLIQITGIDSQPSYVLEDLPEALPETNLSSSEIQNHPLVRKLDREIAAAEQDLRIAKSRRWPKAFLVSRYRREEESFYEKNALEAGVMVQFNVWDFSQTSNDIREKRSILTEQQLKKDSEIKTAKLELKKSFNALSVRAKTISISQQTLKMAEENFKNAKAKHMQGDVSDLAINEAKIQLLQAQTEVAKAVCDYWIIQAETQRLAESVGAETGNE